MFLSLNNTPRGFHVDLETFTYGPGRQKLISEASGVTYYVWGGSSIIAEYVVNQSGNPRYIKAYVYAGSRLLMTAGRTSSTAEKRETHHPDRLGTKRVKRSKPVPRQHRSGTIFFLKKKGGPEGPPLN